MQEPNETKRCKSAASQGRGWVVLVLLTFIVLPVYSNTFSASWQFDDRPNIVNNPAVHITTIDLRSVKSTFFAYQDTFLRPVSYLSFGLNWYFGGNKVVGYRVVNILLHIGCAFLLYLVCINLFKTPALATRDSYSDVFFVAFFSAALWAVNPVQTQAVTYIVQRMAELAAFFYLLGIFFYLKGRLSTGRTRMTCFLVVAGSLFFAVLSKENAIMLPVILLLVEMIFFRTAGSSAAIKQSGCIWVWWGLIIGISCAIALLVFADGNPLFFMNSYSNRPFTLMERVLTESRVVLFYLSLLFYPLPSRLSIAHDVTISTGLFSPWTTIASIVMIIGLIVLSWGLRRKTPLFSFAVLFFFFNHIVESTVIPLELVFEHRNYLPSLFLFLPVVASIKKLADHYLNSNRMIAALILFSLPAVLIGVGRFTYDRNAVWKNSRTLWLDAFSKSEKDARSTAIIAMRLAWGKDTTPQTEAAALRLFQVALKQDQHRRLLAADIYGNIAAIFYRWGNYDKALSLYQKGLAVNPDFTKNRYDMIKTLVRIGRWDEALEEARQLVNHPEKGMNPDYYNLYGFILVWQNQPVEALHWFQQALAIDPYNFPNILLNTGYALSRNGYYKRAEWFYKYWFYKGKKRYPPEITPYFLLIENSVRAGNKKMALIYARNVLASFDVVSVLKKLKAVDTQHETVPMKKALIAPVIKSAFYSLGEEASLKDIF